MADNYIEKRMEEIASGRGVRSSVMSGNTLDTLIYRNRSTRGFDSTYIVNIRQLRAIVSVCARVASARNQQKIRFHLVLNDRADLVIPLVGMGGALPDLHLPLKGTEPNAYIVICTKEPNASFIEFDEGIAAQTMLLKATEMGLNGLIIKCFDRAQLAEVLGLEYTPLTVIAIGRSIEKPELVTVREGESLQYYRQDGKHIVPKINCEDLII